MLVVETIAKIRRAYFQDKKSIKQICRELRVSRNTVRKVIRSGATELTYERTIQPQPKIGPWKDMLDEMLAVNARKPKRERLTRIRIFEELRARGYDGGYDAVRRYAASWSKEEEVASAAAYVPLSFDPGEAYQFDWSHEIVVIDGVTITVKVAHVRLCHSRILFVRAYPRETQEMVFDAHDKAFAFFGGACARGIYDNMKTAVDTIFVGRDRAYNRRFQQMCGHYLVDPVACTPASGWEKGQVENQVGVVRRRFFVPRPRFKSHAELNAWLEDRCVAWAKANPHQELRDRTIWDVFQDERASLVPYVGPFDGFHAVPASVSKTCLVRFDKNRYSVDARAVGRPVEIRAYAERVEFWQDGKIVGQHARTFGRDKAIYDPLHYIPVLGSALLDARSDGASLDQATELACGWDRLEGLVATAAELTDTMAADPLTHVGQGYHRFRRYAPRMLRVLGIEAAGIAAPLLQATALIADDEKPETRPVGFLRRGSKWHRHLNAEDGDGHRLWEVAVLFHLREAFRSGDIWLPHSRRYADLKQALVPAEAVEGAPRLTVPLDPETWLADRKARMTDGLARLAKAARAGAIPGGSIENGVLKTDRLSAAVPQEADELVLDLYDRLPAIRITELLQEVDADIGFTEAFTHLQTGAPCKDQIGMLTVLLAEGLNLGLSKMAEATSTHDYFQLSRLSRWHMESDAINQALAMVIEAQARLPMSQFWGGGVTASSDGQFFPAARQGEAMNLINAKYGSEPGLKAYTHVSDQFGPFATQNIPATVSEAPYILDGLLMNEAGRKISEQYADTGGFTDQVFAVTALLSYRFIPRIRDLPSTRLYLFDPTTAPNELRGLIGSKIREGVIVQNWPGVLRAVATMATGVLPPSQLLKKFAAYPRQHELAVALREIGRIERTLFIIEWLLDADMQRRAQVGLNKGEAHHALKNALRIGRQGEIRDRTTEGQHYRMAGLNLLAAIIIHWNTKHLGQAVAARQRAGLNCAPNLLAHISPLGWAHILLTGEYRWRRQTGASL